MAWRKIDGARTLVTGCSSGIGRELARELARQGARLIVTARREERIRELVHELQEAGTEIHSVVGDITEPGVREALATSVEEHFGALDLLINNAGVGAIGHFAKADEPRLRKIMEVNFFAPAELTRALIPLLQRGTHPMIVNVGSVLWHVCIPKKSEYVASKFALHGWSDALRCELGPQGVDVLLVSPSTTKSEFFDNVLEKRDHLPWLSLGGQSARAVARKTVRAIRWGSYEIILTPGGKALVWADRLFPTVVGYFSSRLG